MAVYGSHLRTRKPVLRWFVVEPRSGDVWDGPFSVKAELAAAVEEYRDRFGSEPVVEQQWITPVYDARNRAGRMVE